MSNKRIILLSIGLVLLIISIGIGYGYLKTNLSINGQVLLASKNKYILKKLDLKNPTLFWGDEYKTKIENIYFETNEIIEIPSDAVISWDVGLRDKKDLIAYIKNGENKNKYDLYIISKGDKIYANQDSSYLFDGFTSLKQINGIELFDTSKVINATHMFSNLNELTELDLSNQLFDVLENATYMFSNNSKMEKIVMGTVNNKLNNTAYMFQNDILLTEIDITNMDTSKVINMSHMFENLTSIENLPTNILNTEKVENFSYMFSNCSNLTEIDLSNINTEKAINMSYMFNGLSKIEKIDAKTFNPTNLNDMNHMFNNCNSLKTIDLTNLSQETPTNMSYSFANNPSLKTIYLNNFDPSKINEFEEILSNIYTNENILEIYVKNETSKNILNSYIDIGSVNILYDIE